MLTASALADVRETRLEILIRDRPYPLVPRDFNKIATREQKLALLDRLFAVLAADALTAWTSVHEFYELGRRRTTQLFTTGRLGDWVKPKTTL